MVRSRLPLARVLPSGLVVASRNIFGEKWSPSSECGKRSAVLDLRDTADRDRLLALAQQDALLRGVTHVFHFAAQAGVRYSLENPRAYVDANVIGSFNVLELARMLKVRHLLYGSTSARDRFEQFAKMLEKVGAAKWTTARL